MLNLKIRRWAHYYGKISSSSLRPVIYYLHHRMLPWILNKYKRSKRSKVKAVRWLRQITVSFPNLFYHWDLGCKLVYLNGLLTDWIIRAAWIERFTHGSVRGLGVEFHFTYSTGFPALFSFRFSALGQTYFWTRFGSCCWLWATWQCEWMLWADSLFCLS